MSRENETELIRRTLAGDQRAFGTLYKAYHTRISCTIARHIGDPDAVEDLVQNTFMRAFLAPTIPKIPVDPRVTTW